MELVTHYYDYKRKRIDFYLDEHGQIWLPVHQVANATNIVSFDFIIRMELPIALKDHLKRIPEIKDSSGSKNIQAISLAGLNIISNRYDMKDFLDWLQDTLKQSIIINGAIKRIKQEANQ